MSLHKYMNSRDKLKERNSLKTSCRLSTILKFNGLTSSLNHNYIPWVLYKLCALNPLESFFSFTTSRNTMKRDFSGSFFCSARGFICRSIAWYFYWFQILKYFSKIKALIKQTAIFLLLVYSSISFWMLTGKKN